MSAPSKSSRGELALGIGFIMAGAFAIVGAGRIHELGLGSNHDPGPKAFPMTLAVCLIAGGAWLIGQGWVRGARDSEIGPARMPDSEDNSVSPGDPDRTLDAVVLFASLMVYVAIMPWLGFSLSTFLFSGSVMWRLGAAPLLAGGSSLILVAGIRLLFVNLFKVQLPLGSIGLPF